MKEQVKDWVISLIGLTAGSILGLRRWRIF